MGLPIIGLEIMMKCLLAVCLSPTCCERTARICWEEFELFLCHLKHVKVSWDWEVSGVFIVLVVNVLTSVVRC